jgi:hypothetical protein
LCYHATAEALAADDDHRLAAVRRMPRPPGGASVVAVAAMFHTAGLPAAVTRCADVTAVREVVAAAGADLGGVRQRFAVAYVRGDGTGHMVIADFEADAARIRFRDYQVDRSGPDAIDDVTTGTHFFVFTRAGRISDRRGTSDRRGAQEGPQVG